jgi:hypothetical protein
MNPTRLMLIVLSILVGVLTFAILGNTNVYAQQSSTTSSSIYLIGTNVECPKGYHENGRTTLGFFCDKDTSTAKTSLMTPATTRTIAGGSAAATTEQLQQHPAIVRMNNNNNNNNNLVSAANVGWANLSPISNLSNGKSSPSLSPIAPRVNTIKQQGQPQLLTISNNTAIQNYTSSLTSQTADPGKLIYLGYHGTAKRSTATTITSKPEGDHSTRDISSKDNENPDTASSGHGSSTHTTITSKPEGDHSTRDISSKDNEKHELHTIHSTNSDNGSKDKEGSSSHTKSSDQNNDNSKTSSSQSNSHIHKDNDVSNKAKKSNSSSKRNNNSHNHGN